MSVHIGSDLIGKPIVSQDGREIGRVEALHVDVKCWSVASIGVKVSKDVLEELNLKRPFIGTQIIQIPTGQVSGATDTIVLKSELSALAFVGGRTENSEDRAQPA